jgi:hypothetical protein
MLKRCDPIWNLRTDTHHGDVGEADPLAGTVLPFAAVVRLNHYAQAHALGSPTGRRHWNTMCISGLVFKRLDIGNMRQTITQSVSINATEYLVLSKKNLIIGITCWDWDQRHRCNPPFIKIITNLQDFKWMNVIGQLKFVYLFYTVILKYLKM